MTSSIHPQAVIDPAATIGEGTTIGPFCVIGPDVTIGRNCVLHSHVVIDCNATIGDDNEIFPFASIMKPQDLKYNGEPTKVVIGHKNRIREYVTINPGTVGDNELTQIGDNNLLMIGVHVAHDCMIGNNNVLANNATLAGHVHVGDNVVIGGLSAFHQFVHIGDHAMIGGMSAVENDVIPYGLVMGERAYLAGINLVGLERRGFAKDDIKTLVRAFKHIFESDDGTFKDRLESAKQNYADNAVVSMMLDFATKDRKRPLCQTK